MKQHIFYRTDSETTTKKKQSRFEDGIDEDIIILYEECETIVKPSKWKVYSNKGYGEACIKKDGETRQV